MRLVGIYTASRTRAHTSFYTQAFLHDGANDALLAALYSLAVCLFYSAVAGGTPRNGYVQQNDAYIEPSDPRHTKLLTGNFPGDGRLTCDSQVIEEEHEEENMAGPSSQLMMRHTDPTSKK